MPSLQRTYIGLGTNMGDRIQNLIDARKWITRIPGVQNARCSSFYLSSPVGYLDQDDFINAVMQLDYDGSATDLFKHLQDIENRMGRQRDPDNQNAPRVIDLDLLIFGSEESSHADLTLPHPRLSQRLFVLKPLLELSPGTTLPGIGKLADLLKDGEAVEEFADQQVYKLGR